jgi:hypothetical protein
VISSTVSRVPVNTAEEVNARIASETQDRVAYFAAAGPAAIERRLAELDREWDIERALETMAASLSLSGVVRGAVGSRRWFLLPGVVAGFLLQHALQGWCPPVPALRRLGFRTAEEIACERYALKALRGDFQEVKPATDTGVQAKADEALRAARS